MKSTYISSILSVHYSSIFVFTSNRRISLFSSSGTYLSEEYTIFWLMALNWWDKPGIGCLFCWFWFRPTITSPPVASETKKVKIIKLNSYLPPLSECIKHHLNDNQVKTTYPFSYRCIIHFVWWFEIPQI